MADYDLSIKISAYLDRHLIIPLLEFISAKDIYNERDILRSRLDLLKDTNMVDYECDIYATLNTELSTDEVLEVFSEKREAVLTKIGDVEDRFAPVKAVFSEKVMKVMEHCQRDATNFLEKLRTDFDFKNEMIDVIYEYSRVYYECGAYLKSAETLYLMKQLCGTDKRGLSAMWGKLACEILLQNWDQALLDVQALRDSLDSITDIPPLQALQQRAWMLHWALFVFFNHPKGKETLVDWFLADAKNLNAIQTLAPHLLRYLTACVIIVQRKRKQVFKEMVKVIQMESYTYRDPITEFLECLHVNFDFDGAQEKLKKCVNVLDNDFFLVACIDDFIENARHMIFETFCRIHQVLSIDMLAEKLNMSPEEAEKWIVNLIRNARLDAKIDSQLGHVVMGTQIIAPYQVVLEKTRYLTNKSQMLLHNMERKLGLGGPEVWTASTSK